MQSNECSNRPQKTISILIVNDLSYSQKMGSGLDAEVSHIFNEMKAHYTGIGGSSYFKCTIDLQLVGQLTFSSGMPAAIPRAVPSILVSPSRLTLGTGCF